MHRDKSQYAHTVEVEMARLKYTITDFEVITSTHTHTHTRAHAHAHIRTHAHAHSDKSQYAHTVEVEMARLKYIITNFEVITSTHPHMHIVKTPNTFTTTERGTVGN